MRGRYIVLKSFNNNVILCKSIEEEKECILIGKGIGFNKKKNDSFNDVDLIEKVFYIADDANRNKLKGLYGVIDNKIIGATEEVIAMAHNFLNREMDEKIHTTLLDHIAFAIERYNNGIDIKNPFFTEIKSLYREEYLAAEKALQIINDRIGIELPNDEIGFIAMHFHAALNRQDISKTTYNTEIINSVVKYVEEKEGTTIDKDSYDYARFVIHIRFALDRIYKNIPINNILIDSIREKFTKSFSIALDVGEKIKEEYGIELPIDEIGYRAIHIEKIFKNI